MPLSNILDTFNGLPSHALVVHFTVVVATGGAVGGVAYALVPRVRRWASWPLLVTGVLSIVLGLVTPSTGEHLERRTEPSALLERHTELGGQMGTILIVYGAVLILMVLVVRYRRRDAAGRPDATAPTALDRLGGLPGEAPRAFPGQPQAAAGLTLLVLVLAVLSGVWIYRTGEAGARSVWHDTPAATTGAGAGEGR